MLIIKQEAPQKYRGLILGGIPSLLPLLSPFSPRSCNSLDPLFVVVQAGVKSFGKMTAQNKQSEKGVK